MRLNFRHIEMHSFMSFEDETFDFDQHEGMTLIRGRNFDLPNNETNGSGKTATFGALLYVLFGRLRNDIKNENIVNRFVSDKDMRVALTFDVDGDEYRVVRGIAKGKSSYLELYSGEDDITKSTIAETQNYIETEVIKCDIAIFLRTVLLTSKQTYNFYELKKADKKEFVEKLFDISVFGDMYQEIHRDTLDCDRGIVSGQNRLMMLNRQDDDYRNRMSKYDADRSARLESLGKSISEANASYDKMKKNTVEKNTAEIEKVEAVIEKISEARRKLVVSGQETDQKSSKIELAMHKLKSTKESKQLAIDKHADIMGRLCEECQPVFAEYYGIAGFKAEISEISKKMTALTESAKAVSAKKADISGKIQLFDDKLDLARGKIRALNEKYNKASRDMAVLESNIRSLENDLAKAKSDKNPYADLYDANLKNIAAENAALDQLSEKYRYLKFAETIVSQETLRKFIISDLIGLLNNKIKTYLTKLGAKYTVVFDSDMNYKFTTEGGQCEFGNFSDGEEMRIMIATSFAFRDFMSIRNGLSSNVLILDEYFDSAISAACVENILGVLKEYVRDYNQSIYCISHRPEVSVENFESVIEVQKKNNISRITYSK